MIVVEHDGSLDRAHFFAEWFDLVGEFPRISRRVFAVQAG